VELWSSIWTFKILKYQGGTSVPLHLFFDFWSVEKNGVWSTESVFIRVVVDKLASWPVVLISNLYAESFI
jgi:hypothetical protein